MLFLVIVCFKLETLTIYNTKIWCGNICNSISVPFVEHSKGAMISIVSTCENGHITVNTQENWFHLHFACAVMIYVIKGPCLLTNSCIESSKHRC